MSSLSFPSQSMFFFSVLYHFESLKEDEILKIIELEFSKITGSFSVFFHPFCPMKEYYSKEMGPVSELRRIFLYSFIPVEQDCLVTFKLKCIELEKNWQKDKMSGKSPFRNANIDVGMVSLENVILATGKMFTHRIHLSRGIYADLTLIFKGETYVSLPWSYPDYGHPEIIEFFNWYRKNLQISRQ